jgi:hypothetical protein
MRMNKVATNKNQGFSNANLILALREAELKVIKSKLNPNNLLQKGFDQNAKRMEDLQNLMVPFEMLTPTMSNAVYTRYQVDLGRLSSRHIVLTEISTKCSRGECKNRIVAVNKLVKHGELENFMADANFSPSYEWQTTLAQITDNILYIYTDGVFKVDEVFIEYLRYPIPVDIAGYKDFNGNPSVNQDSELRDYLEDEILNAACLELGIATDNQTIVQAAPMRSNSTE